MGKVYTPTNIFHIYSPYFQNGWKALDDDMAGEVVLTDKRNTGDRVTLLEDGTTMAHNPYTGYMVHAPNAKALLAFGKKETKRHLAGFYISPWIDFLSDCYDAMKMNGSEGVVDIDLRVVEDALCSPLMPLRGGAVPSFQYNLTGLSALDIQHRPDGTTYIPGMSPLCRMATCVVNATDPKEAFESSRRGGKTLTWIFDSKGFYTHYGKNILNMVRAANGDLVEALAMAYTVAKNRQKSQA